MTTLSGTVTLSGSAQSGVPVLVIDTDNSSDPSQWTIVETATTDSNGDWSVSGLAEDADERYHAIAQYDDGTQYNALSKPYLSTPSAIPDSGDLQARYDWTGASGTSTVTDLSGNGHDLTGTYTGPTATINGNQAGEFDGADDLLTVDWTDLPQPNHVFMVYQFIADSDDVRSVIDGDSDGRQKFGNNGQGNIDLYAGNANNVVGGDADTKPHVVSALFDGANSALRLDGADVASGDAGGEDSGGLTVGAEPGGGNYADVYVGEILHYPMDKSGSQSDIEGYLADKWGITL